MINMDSKTQKRLLEINQNFYDDFSKSFSLTRHQVQPGVRQTLQQIGSDTSVLDVGCGNGTFARALAAQGFSGTYLGLDMSQGLLDHAKKLQGITLPGSYDFRHIDLANPDWTEEIHRRSYDWLVCFAVLHHIPGADLRQKIVHNFAKLVTPQSNLVISVWQWKNSPKLRKRVMPWSEIGLRDKDVDPGDVLMDWRASNTIGLRYIHTFTNESLTELAENCGFNVIESFYADGKTGDLALYHVWHKKQTKTGE